MGLFSKSVADVDEYRFEPQPDITAHELATILMRLSPTAFADAPYLKKVFTSHGKQFPPEVERHFQFVQRTVIDV